MTDPLLTVEDLHTYFYSMSKRSFIRSVDNANFTITKGETLGVVGESGSGKSVTALSIMGLVGGGPGVIRGKIGFQNNNTKKNFLQDIDKFVRITERNNKIMDVSKDEAGWDRHVERMMCKVRGKDIAMIFQNPKSSLNPFTTVGRQITEAIKLHTAMNTDKEARDRALYWLDRVKIDTPRLRFDNYPYGLSGGMCQRVMVAMALACEPSLLIADEPTTGLDATIQSKVVDLLVELKAELGITSMLISHDISIISRLSDSVAVMYGGTIVEYGPKRSILSKEFAMKHPYTAALMDSIPSGKNIREKGYLHAIEGDVLDTINIPEGCRFFPRCNRVTDGIREKCEHSEPDLREITPGHKVRCWLYFD